MDSAVLLDLLGNENRRRILRLLSRKPCYVTEISEYLGVSPKAVIDHLRKLEDAGLIESHTDDRRRKYFHIAQDVRLEVNVSRHGFGTKSAYPANPSLDISGRCPHVRIDIDLPDAHVDGAERNGAAGAERNGAAGADADADSDAAPTDDAAPGGAAADGTAADGAGAADAGAADADAAVEAGAAPPDSAGGDHDVGDLAAEFERLQQLENEVSLAQRWVHGRMTALLDRLNDRLGVDADSRFFAQLLSAVDSTDGTVRAIAGEVSADRGTIEEGLQQLRESGMVERDGDRWVVA